MKCCAHVLSNSHNNLTMYPQLDKGHIVIKLIVRRSVIGLSVGRSVIILLVGRDVIGKQIGSSVTVLFPGRGVIRLRVRHSS